MDETRTEKDRIDALTGEYPYVTYVEVCDTCDRIGASDWYRKASSDADWHNTMSGHRVIVADVATGRTVYDTHAKG